MAHIQEDPKIIQSIMNFWIFLFYNVPTRVKC